MRNHLTAAVPLILLGSLPPVMVSLAPPTSSSSATAPWPMFRHDLRHTGLSAYSGPSTPTEKWDFTWNYTEGGRAGYVDSSPAIGPDGTVYVASADGDLYAIGGASPTTVSTTTTVINSLTVAEVFFPASAISNNFSQFVWQCGGSTPPNTAAFQFTNSGDSIATVVDVSIDYDNHSIGASGSGCPVPAGAVEVLYANSVENTPSIGEPFTGQVNLEGTSNPVDFSGTFAAPVTTTSSSTTSNSLQTTTASTPQSTTPAVGGIPDFPYTLAAMVVLIILLAVSYLVVRSRLEAR